MSEDRLSLISRLQSMIHDCLKEHVKDGPLAILDFPDIRNVGDSAIWLGEVAYLKDRYAKFPDYVCVIRDYSDEAIKKLPSDAPIFIHGGGNFGDIWLGHQRFRERIMERWPDRKIIQFPQSIHYDDEGRADETARIIDKVKDFTLLVRDEESLQFAQKRFNCAVKICPDMAFCIGPVEQAFAPRHDVLAMLRADKETSGARDMSPYPEIPVEDWISESRNLMRATKLMGRLRGAMTLKPAMVSAMKYDAAANARFQRGRRQLSAASAIVTDRLHVHIISLLMGKPHAVLDNHYGKIRRYMDAFSGTTDLAYRAASLDDAVQWARARAAEAR